MYLSAFTYFRSSDFQLYMKSCRRTDMKSGTLRIHPLQLYCLKFCQLKSLFSAWFASYEYCFFAKYNMRSILYHTMSINKSFFYRFHGLALRAYHTAYKSAADTQHSGAHCVLHQPAVSILKQQGADKYNRCI